MKSLILTISGILLCLALPLNGARVMAQGSDYRLGVGDILHIQVLNPGFETYSCDVAVQPDGEVKLPVKPPVSIHATGMTLDRFERVTQQAYAGFIRLAAVTVTLRQTRPMMVYMLGSFGKDGGYPLLGVTHALDAVALAGGAPTGDLSQVVFQRGHVTRTLDLAGAQKSASSPDNVLLEPNDALFVPEKRSHVTVQGQVRTPANIDFKPGLALDEALAIAGGPADLADLTRVTIKHSDGSLQTVNLSQEAGITHKDVPLHAGDEITVPQQLALLTVQGQVAKPLVMPYRPNILLVEAIAMAGGPTPQADESHVWLVRPNGEQRSINLYQMIQQGQEDHTVLRPGDIITVPEQAGRVTVLGEVTASQLLEYKPGLLLEQALAAAGGPTKQADLSQVTIVRSDNTTLKIDLQQDIRDGAKDDTALEPGDVVTVPELKAQVLVVGAIAKPQPIPYRPELTLDKVIAIAGGETDKADLSHVKLARIDPPGIETIDLLKARQDGTVTQIALRAGDVVTVPELTEQVFVLGSVGRPGAVPYRPDMTLLEALTGPGESTSGPQGASGPTGDADLYDATLTRASGKIVPIDLDKMIRGGDRTQNLVLDPGDVLYVPESKRLVYVFGAVTHPGAYRLPLNDKHNVLDALNAAGGTLATADLGRAVLVENQNGAAASTPVHLDRLLKKGETQFNTPLKAGDALYVPQHGQANNWWQNVIPGLLYLVPRP